MESSAYRWQSECLEKWIEHECRGIAHVVTGAGKTRLALMAVEYLQSCSAQPLHTMIVVPTCALMEQWVKELKKTFGSGRSIARAGGGFYGNPDAEYQVMVVNTAREVLPQRRNALLAKDRAVFLVCDECHHYGSVENRRIFSGIALSTKNYYTLGLSATPYCVWFHMVLKPSLGDIVYCYRHEDALRDRIIAPFIIEQIAISFSGEEAEKYARLSVDISLKLNKLLAENKVLSKLPPSEFFHALIRMKEDGDELAENVVNLLIERKRLVLLAESRIHCAERLVEMLPEENRIIIFCERICQAETIYSALENIFRNRIGKYHSQRTAEQNHRDIRQFKDGEIRILVACKALDEGIDVPEADVAIVISGTAMERQHIQRLGRILRKSMKEDKVGVLYYLYVKESAEERQYLSDAADEDRNIDLVYSVNDGFSCAEYEDAAFSVLEKLKSRGADEAQLREARDCILDGLMLADWKRSPEYCAKKATEAVETKNTRRENYWRCMKWMAEIKNSTGSIFPVYK